MYYIGKVADVRDTTAKAFNDGYRSFVDVSLVDVSVGDSVIVHAGCAIETVKISKEEELYEILNELECVCETY